MFQRLLQPQFQCCFLIRTEKLSGCRQNVLQVLIRLIFPFFRSSIGVFSLRGEVESINIVDQFTSD